jgi:D-glucosaminate-specific PTS system IID component
MEERKLTRKDLRRCWRAWMMHNLSSMSFERLASFGFCLSMLPVAKKAVSGCGAAHRKCCAAMHRFYNTEPQIGAIVNGMTLGLEEKKANGEPIDGETINTLKVGLMGPVCRHRRLHDPRYADPYPAQYRDGIGRRR